MGSTAMMFLAVRERASALRLRFMAPRERASLQPSPARPADEATGLCWPMYIYVKYLTLDSFSPRSERVAT